MQRGQIFKWRRSWRLRFRDHKASGGVKSPLRSVFLARVEDCPDPEALRFLADEILAPVNEAQETMMRNKLRKSRKFVAAPRRPSDVEEMKRRDKKLESQAYKCAICGTDRPGRRGWHFDHDHKTGLERDALCAPCNLALGLVRDDERILLEMVLYLRRHRLAAARENLLCLDSRVGLTSNLTKESEEAA